MNCFVFLLLEIQFEFLVESFLETKFGNNPIAASICSGKCTLNRKFILSLCVSLIFSGEYII